jgi:hypothetical protein
MAQHDNGRRPGGTQSGTWQQGHRDPQDFGHQQDQSSGSRFGAPQGGGQQGGYGDPGGSRGHQDQYDAGRGQQGDNWRERQGPAAGGWRPAMEERDRSGDPGRGDSTGGYGSSNDGPGQGGGAGWNAQRAWRDEARQREFGSTWGPSSADNDPGSRGRQGAPGNQDRYGDNGYQGNFQQGQRGQSYHDPDYHQWRSEQLSRLDRDYDEWRQHRYQRFSEDFDNWRANRDNNASARSGSQAGAGGQQPASSEVSGQQASASKHDVAGGGDKGAAKTATK